MSVTEGHISIKATTTEKLSFVGREEGVSAYAVALIEKVLAQSGLVHISTCLHLLLFLFKN